jgi:biopolymer transport protein ExbD
VLRHEMAHIRRRDGLVRPFETLVRALYWFHPLVVLLVRHADVYREQSCDEVAAAPNPAGRLAYSRHLVDIAEHLLTGSAVRGSASTIMRRRDELLGRVRYLTKEGPIMKLTKARAAALAVVLVAAVVSLSWYQGAATPPKKAKKGIDVSLQAGGTITVNGKKAPLEKLGAELKKSIDDREHAVVNIVCDDGVEMKTLFQMHAILRGAGLLKVRYADQGGEPVPLMLPSKELIEKSKQIAAENITTLAVAPGGVCTLDGKKLPADKIHEVVAKHLQANPKLIVSVKMAGGATYGQYVHALRELGRAEAKRIFIQEPGGA